MPSGARGGKRRARREGVEAEPAPGGGAARADAKFAARCEVLRRYYASVDREEWWWLMDDSLEVIAGQLEREGYCVLDGFLPPRQSTALQREVEGVHRAGRLEAAGLVNGKADSGAAKYMDTATRGDVIGWFDANEECWPYGRTLDSYLLKLGTLIQELKGQVPELKKVTGRSKAMVACYPGDGARYIKHVDNDGKHPLCRTRLLTGLMYLNDGWRAGDGGELAVLGPADASGQNPERQVVEPLSGRLVLFWSDWRIPHEVRAAHKPRYAVTLWFLDSTQKAAEAEPPPQLPAAPSPASAETAAAAGGGSAVATGAAATGRGAAEEADAEPPPELQAAPPPATAGTVAAADGGGAAATGAGGATATGRGAPEAPSDAKDTRACENAAVRYEWHRLGEQDEGPWELQVELLGETAECPALDLSDTQVRVTSASGDALLCLPLPLRPGPPASKWSRRRRLLTVRLEPAAPLAAAAEAAAPALASQLRARGWGLLDGFLPAADADALRSFVMAKRAAGRLRLGHNSHEGAVGSGKAKNDEYAFMEKHELEEPGAASLKRCQRRLNELIVRLMREQALPSLAGVQLTQGRPMVAVYPGGGAHYGRHYDSMSQGRGNNGRVMTFIIYLNPFWKEAHGGSLCLLESLKDEAGSAVEPLHGRLVGFLCQDRCPHEVLPSWDDRIAVTIWYYDGARLAERCQAGGEEIAGFGFEAD